MLVKVLHEIVTPERRYSPGPGHVEMPQALIDEMLPLGAVEIVKPYTSTLRRKIPT